MQLFRVFNVYEIIYAHIAEDSRSEYINNNKLYIQCECNVPFAFHVRTSF
jgi:hypothetical protein